MLETGTRLPDIIILHLVSSWKTSPAGGVGVWVGGHLTPPSQGLYASGGQKGCQHPHPSHQGPYIAKRNN